jgi:hypothetical protein
MPCSTGKFIIHRLGAIPALLLLLSSVGACKFATAPKAPTRIGASDTIIIPDRGFRAQRRPLCDEFKL